MDVRNCKQCGNLFNFVSGLPLCSSCIKKIDEKFSDVKKFIYENPGADMTRVSEEFEIPIPVIKRWVKEERLSFVAGSGITLDCERCGKPILTGRYCERCKGEMSKALGGVYKAPEPTAEKKQDKSSSAKMRFLDNTKNL